MNHNIGHTVCMHKFFVSKYYQYEGVEESTWFIGKLNIALCYFETDINF